MILTDIQSDRNRKFSDPGATFWVWRRFADATLFAGREQRGHKLAQG